MANVQQIQMRKECLQRTSLALGREITPSEGHEILAGIRAGMLRARAADPDAWRGMSHQQRVDAATKLYQETLKAEAKKIRQRAYLSVLAQANVERSLAFQRKRGYHGYSAAGQVLSEIDRRVIGAQSEADNDFLVAIDGKQKGITGLFTDLNFEEAVTKEVFGEDSGSQIAKYVAAEWKRQDDAGIDRYNAEGGNIVKLDHYIPQTHDTRLMSHAVEVLAGQGKLRRFANDVERWIRDAPSSYDANRAAWVQFIEPLIDRSKYIDLNGDPMSDQDFIEMLGRAFDTICSDGANSDFEVSTVAGPSASRANRGDLHRGLHFKDASSWLQYQRTFGQGTVFDLMRGSLRRSAKDAELMRSLGPNPNATYAAMKRMAKAEADQINAKMQGRPGIVQTMKAGLSEHYIDTEWSVLNGSAASVDASRAALADISGGMRNLEVATKLGSTFLSSVSDIPTYYSTARLMGIPAWTATRNLIAAWGSEARDLAVRGGIMADALSSACSRWGLQNVGSGWTGKLASATMKYSLLDAFTNGVRRAEMINYMGMMSWLVKTDWSNLTPYQRRVFERCGVNEMDWILWQEAKPYKIRGAGFLTREDIRNVDIDALSTDKQRLVKLVPNGAPTARDMEHAVTSYLAVLREESGLASLAPDLGTRALSNIAGPRGTFAGEAVRGLLLFKSFPIGFMRRHLERMSDIAQTEGSVSRAKYAALIFTTTTMAGAISVQLRALASGRDLQDPTPADYWMQAMSVGGGAGFLADLIVAGMDGENTYGSPNWLKFMGPVTGTVLDAWDVGKSYYNDWRGSLANGLYNRQTKSDAKALRFARSHMPFVNLWYLKGIIDRAVYNDMMEASSPGYLARIESWGPKHTGQEYWWAPTEIVPKRMPRVANAPE